MLKRKTRFLCVLVPVLVVMLAAPLATALAQGGGVTATADSGLQLRSGPGTNYASLGAVPIGATVSVRGRSAGGDWLLVEYGGSRGWVAGWLVTVNGNLKAVPVSSEVIGSPVWLTTQTALRMRSGPGYEYEELDSTVPSVVSLPMLGRTADSAWFLVEYGGERGWIAGWLCWFDGDLSLVPIAGVAGSGKAPPAPASPTPKATPTEEPSPTPEDVTATVDSTPETVPAGARLAENRVRLTFDDLGIGSLSLMGIYGEAHVWIPLQSNWVVEGPIEVSLVYVASPLLTEERTTLTVLSDGKQISSIYPVADGAEHVFSFEVPQEFLADQGIRLDFEGHLTLPPVECPETHNPAQWLKILGESSVTITSTLDTSRPGLEDLPQAIMVQNAPDSPPPTIFVLPDNPDATALTTAAQVAARLGKAVGRGLLPIEIQTAGELTEKARTEANLVVIGLPENQPLIGEMGNALPAPQRGDGFRGADGTAVKPEHAVIQIFNSPWDPTRRVLLVSAGSRDGLQLAGQAFADSATFQSLQGSFEEVQSLRQWPDAAPGRPWSTDITSFAQLDFYDRNVTGSGSFNEYFSFYLPPGWALQEGSQLMLHVTSSPALHSGVSHVEILLNEVPVGVIRTGEGFEESEVTFDLPITELVDEGGGAHPQLLILRLSVANYLHEINCEETHHEAAWTAIYTDSYLVTPHTYLPLPNLQAFPYPFVSDLADAPPVAIVLPSQPDSREMGMGLSLAASLGRFTPADFKLSVLTADQVSPEAQGDAHLIILGTRARQPLIDEMNAGMPPIPDEAFGGLSPTPDAGWLHEDVSPWNPDRMVLLVYAESDAGLENAADSLFNMAPPVNQEGSLILVEADQPPRVIFCATCAPPEAGEEGAGTASPTEEQPESEGQIDVQSIPLPQMLGVVTAIFAVAAAAILGTLWFRRRRAGESGPSQEEEPEATDEE